MLNGKIDFLTLSKIEKEFGSFDIGQVHGGGNPMPCAYSLCEGDTFGLDSGLESGPH